MSNSLAIAAVTATIRDLLNKVAQPLPFDPNPDPDLNDAECSTKPPDKARTEEAKNQLNLFLYQTSWSGAMRNNDMVLQVRPGETAMSPLALNLQYLVTAYGKGNDDILSHRLLGRAMSLLHDRALLMAANIEVALKNNDLYRQVERIRITPHPLSTEELSKLWAVFQTPYRISASYEVSVVLIDSARRTLAPPPVLIRGAIASPDMVPPFPTLDGVTLALPNQPSARLPSGVLPGDTVIFTGHHLDGFGVALHLTRAILDAPYPLTPTAPTAVALPVTLPDDQFNLPAGPYSVTAVVSESSDPALDRETNTVALAIAPRILTIDPQPAVRDPAGKVTVTVTCSPQVWIEQRASLLVGSAEFIAKPRLATTDTLEFVVSNLPSGTQTYLVRLRIDGVDSHLVDYAADPPAFDASQSMVVQ